MRISTSLALKINALVLVLFTPVFFITVLSLHTSLPIPDWLVPEIRGNEYRWDFELMFMTIYAVWAFFLWKASQNPSRHTLFIDFTIVTNIAHGLIMIFIGILNGSEFMHLLIDGLILILPAFILYFSKKNFNQ